VLKRPKNGSRVCKECFFACFEQEVHETIIRGNLFQRGEKVAIGASGGKDSTVLAYVLKALNERYDYGVEFLLLSIDEGITGYRDDSLECVKQNSRDYGLPCHILSYKDLYGWSMDDVVAEIGLRGNCTFCGVFRRQALDRGAKALGVAKITTGHNADDMAETVLMNLLRGDIARLGRCASAVTGAEGDMPRSKPFKYCYEKEIVMYAYHRGLVYFSTECIYSPNAYRGFAREFIKDLEIIRPSAILDIIHSAEAWAVRESGDAARGSSGRAPMAAATNAASASAAGAASAGSASGGCGRAAGAGTCRATTAAAADSAASAGVAFADSSSRAGGCGSTCDGGARPCECRGADKASDVGACARAAAPSGDRCTSGDCGCQHMPPGSAAGPSAKRSCGCRGSGGGRSTVAGAVTAPGLASSAATAAPPTARGSSVAAAGSKLATRSRVQATCVRCGYMTSTPGGLCQACNLLAGLEAGKPRLGLTSATGSSVTAAVAAGPLHTHAGAGSTRGRDSVAIDEGTGAGTRVVRFAVGGLAPADAAGAF
jgi:cytoplasmic tRNA 2-thiolation protein 1